MSSDMKEDPNAHYIFLFISMASEAIRSTGISTLVTLSDQVFGDIASSTELTIYPLSMCPRWDRKRMQEECCCVPIVWRDQNKTRTRRVMRCLM